MLKRCGPRVLGILALFLIFDLGCKDSNDPTGPGDNPPPPDDTTVPGPVTDLSRAEIQGTLVTLNWTAPGDDGDVGTASEYDLRFGRSSITSTNWHSCYQCFTEPDPAVAGTVESVTIDVGSTGSWYFALRTADEVPNWSTLSNNLKVTIQDGPLYDIRQLTHSGNNRYPSLDDGVVAWVGSTAEGDEIWVAGLTGASATPSKLTDNAGEKNHPDSHGSERIVWSGREPGTYDWEIWVYDKYAIPRFRALTDDDQDDLFPELAGAGDIAWIKGATMFGAVFYWNESSHDPFPISEDCCPTSKWSNGMLSADDGAVVWRAYDRSGGEGHKTYLWSGTLTNLTDVLDATLAVDYSLDAGTIAYQYASNRMIRYWDGVAVHDVAAGYSPSLDAGKVAYEVWDNHDWEIYYWDGATAYQITKNDYDDTQPSLSGSMIAWAGRPEGPGGLYQIFYVDLSSGPAGE